MYFIIKRFLDIVGSLIGLIVFSPLFLIVSIFIFIDSGWPVFFMQERVGKNFKLFKICKFRTMIVAAQKKGPSVSMENDKRVTSVGKFLRRYKLDELPQLANVLIGQMSLVGPRPEVQKYVDQFSKEYNHILKVKPGMTDKVSLEFSDENKLLRNEGDPEKKYISEILPRKIELYRRYEHRNSIFSEFIIIMKTIKKIICNDR